MSDIMRQIKIDTEVWEEARLIGENLPVKSGRPAVIREAIRRGLKNIKEEL